MPGQNVNFNDTVLLVIALLAIIVFVFVLITALMIIRAEGKTKKDLEPDEEHKPSLTARRPLRLFSRENPSGDDNARQKGIVDSLKTLSRVACYIIATYVAFLGYDHVQRVLLSLFPIPSYYYWSAHTLAIISPACIGVAWLRLTGERWQKALRLFLFVPVGVFVIWYIVNILPYRIAN